MVSFGCVHRYKACRLLALSDSKWQQQTANGVAAVNNMLAGAIFVAFTFTAFHSVDSIAEPRRSLSTARESYLQGILFITKVTAFGACVISSGICQALLAVWKANCSHNAFSVMLFLALLITIGAGGLLLVSLTILSSLLFGAFSYSWVSQGVLSACCGVFFSVLLLGCQCTVQRKM